MPTPPTLKKLKYNQVECSLNIPPEEVTSLEEEVLKKCGSQMNIKGFRAGHAPLDLVRSRIGHADLLEEVLRAFLGKSFPSIVKEHNLKPIIPPKITVTANTPLTLSIVLTEHPDTQVRTKSITVEKKEPKVEEKDIDRVIQSLLKEHQGKAEKLPELTNAFAQEHCDMASVEELKKNVRESLERHATSLEYRRQEQDLIEAIRKATTVHLVPELLEHEFRELEQEFLGGLREANMTIDQWLKRAQKTWENVAKEFRAQAERRLQIRFGIEKLLVEKPIDITPEELQSFIDGFITTLPENEQPSARERFRPGTVSYDDLLWRKKVEKLFHQLLA